MKLSEFFNSGSIIRDADFEALGLSNSHINKCMVSFFDDERFYEEIKNNNKICAIICRKEDVQMFDYMSTIGIVISNNPRKDYFLLHNRLSRRKGYCIEKRKTIVGNNCSISKLSSISCEGVEIGNNVIIDDFVKIQGPCIIGDNTVIRSCCIIGGNGFEFKRYSEEVLDVIHCGNVCIGSNVILWENVTVHRAVYPWDSTVIGDWSRIGVQSHVDHGAKVGQFVEICAKCTISGRVHIGKHAFIGPGSILSNRIVVGDYSKVLLGSVVTNNISDGCVVSGNFAIEHDKHINRVIADSSSVYR